MSSADEVLRSIADRNLSIVTRAEALARHVSESELRTRLASGVLRRVHRGVYLFGAGALSFEQRCLAAAARCGDDAFVSHVAAAALWRMVEGTPERIDVTVPFARARVPTGVRTHRSRAMSAVDRTMRGVVPISTPARTLLDLAAKVDPMTLERAADEAFRKHLISPERLAKYLAGRARTPGIGVLTKVAKDRFELGVTDSELEMSAIRVLRSYGLPAPVRQRRFVADGRRGRFDLMYPDENLVIELNGEAPHWGRDRWQNDHDRNNAIELSGARRLEFTWWDVHDRPQYFVVTVADALGLRPSRWRKKSSRGR